MFACAFYIVYGSKASLETIHSNFSITNRKYNNSMEESVTDDFSRPLHITFSVMNNFHELYSNNMKTFIMVQKRF